MLQRLVRLSLTFIQTERVLQRSHRNSRQEILSEQEASNPSRREPWHEMWRQESFQRAESLQFAFRLYLLTSIIPANEEAPVVLVLIEATLHNLIKHGQTLTDHNNNSNQAILYLLWSLSSSFEFPPSEWPSLWVMRIYTFTVTALLRPCGSYMLTTLQR